MEGRPEAPAESCKQFPLFFFQHQVPSLGQRPIFPCSPISCLVWGLHPPACQHVANLAQLSGLWIRGPGLQPIHSSREGGEGIPEQTVGRGQSLHTREQCVKGVEQQPAAVPGQKPL